MDNTDDTVIEESCSDQNQTAIQKRKLNILVTEEDKTGRDIAKMSDFFDGYIRELSLQIGEAAPLEVMDSLPVAELGVVNELFHHAGIVMKGEYGYLPDFDSLDVDIQKKLRKGIYTIGESRQVEGNMRAVILDEEGVRIKDITLKKVMNDTGTLDTFRNITNQVQLKQINAKLSAIQMMQNYQVESDRNNRIIVPFLNARDYILRAQTGGSDEEKRENLIKASDEMTRAINALYADMDTTGKWIARLTSLPILQATPLVNRFMGFMSQDLQLTTKYVGIQMHIFDYLDQSSSAVLELEKYKSVMRDFSDRAINRNGDSTLMLMHNYCKYDDTNKDSWLLLKKELMPILQSEQKPVEAIYLVSAEDVADENE